MFSITSLFSDGIMYKSESTYSTTMTTCHTNIFSDVNGSYYILWFRNMIHLPRHALMNDIAYLWYVHLFISSVRFKKNKKKNLGNL